MWARVNGGGGSVVEMTEVLVRRLLLLTEEKHIQYKRPSQSFFPSANTRVISKQTSEGSDTRALISPAAFHKDVFYIWK